MTSKQLDKLSGIKSPANLTTQEGWELIRMVRNGLSYSVFDEIVDQCTYHIHEWANFLQVTDKTVQNYRKKSGSFDILRSERILRILFLSIKGKDVFGDPENFHTWLTGKSIAMGGIHPIELMDSSFGIQLIEDELGRIEHGVLA